MKTYKTEIVLRQTAGTLLDEVFKKSELNARNEDRINDGGKKFQMLGVHNRK